jgi:pheromone shutdown protein TraB
LCSINFRRDPGGEFRAAIAEAERVGADIHLVDQPLTKTFGNVWKVFSWSRIANVPLSDKAREMKEQTDAAVKKGRKRDDGSRMEIGFDRMTREDLRTEVAHWRKHYPEIIDVMIDERDAYMARAIAGSCGSPRVIVVCGLAHVDGIARRLAEDDGKLWTATATEAKEATVRVLESDDDDDEDSDTDTDEEVEEAKHSNAAASKGAGASKKTSDGSTSTCEQPHPMFVLADLEARAKEK